MEKKVETKTSSRGRTLNEHAKNFFDSFDIFDKEKTDRMKEDAMNGMNKARVASSKFVDRTNEVASRITPPRNRVNK